MRQIGRGTALFVAGVVAGVAIGALLGGVRAPRPDGEVAASQVSRDASDAADRSVGRRGVVFAPLAAGEPGGDGRAAGPEDSAGEARPGRGAAARSLPSGDPTAAIVLEALRAAASPMALAPHAAAGATLTAAAGEGRRIGRISGHLRRPDGAPIAGAVVSLVPSNLGEDAFGYGASPAADARGGPPADASTPEHEMASALKMAVIRYARFRALSREVRTDDDGAYEAADLAPIPYDVSATHPGAPIDADRAHVYDILPDAVVDLVGIPAAPLSLLVVKPDGAPADGAYVDANGPARRSWCWSADAATVWVQPGTYVIEAHYAQGGVTLRSRTKTVLVEESDEGAPVRVELAPAPQITGRIVPAQPQEAPDIALSYVMYTRVPPDAKPDPELFKRKQRSTSPQADGRYVIDDVGPGRWIVGVARTGEYPAACEVVDLTDSPVVKDLALPPIDESRAIAVRVVGPDGAPRGGASVSLECSFPDGNEMSNDSVMERPGGHYLLLIDANLKKRLSGPRQQGERFAIHVSVPGIGSTTRRLTSVGGGEITIQLGPGSTLSVVVEGIGGAIDEERATVVLAPLDALGQGDPIDGARGDCARSPDAQGRALLGPVEAGAYALLLVYESESIRGRREVARKKVDLVPGENQAVLEAPSLAKVVVEGVPEGNVWLYPVGGDEDWYSDVDRDSTGRVELDELSPGAYALVAYNGDLETSGLMALRVSGSLACRFQPERPERVELRAVNVDDGLRGAGIERGDVLLSLCGKPLADPYNVYNSVQKILEAEGEGESPSPEGAENASPEDDALGDPPPSARPSPAQAQRRLQVLRSGRPVELVLTSPIERSFQYGIQRWRPMPRR